MALTPKAATIILMPQYEQIFEVKKKALLSPSFPLRATRRIVNPFGDFEQHRDDEEHRESDPGQRNGHQFNKTVSHKIRSQKTSPEHPVISSVEDDHSLK